MDIKNFKTVAQPVRKKDAMQVLLGKPVYTDDVTPQNALVVKLLRSPLPSSVSSPRAWIWQMARNLAIDALRKEHPASPLPEEDDSPRAPDDIKALHQRLDLEQAFSRLDPLSRQIVTLHVDADLTFAQIADITALSLPRVYRIYKKAISP